ncbi:MAG: helix-turn-helix domain-containing protein [Lewinella sp.]|uniref:AraC family transcriptional regulator n=1 Tax=Lewinella sp. TaxID=2004506 RepID=UPI003D6BA758
MSDQIFTLVSCYVILHCLGTGLLCLFSRQGPRSNNRIEALWLFTIAVCLSSYLLSMHRLLSVIPLAHIFRATWALLPPVMYLYFRSLSGVNPWVSPWQFLHFFPFAVKVVFLSPFFLAPLVSRDGVLSEVPSAFVELFFYRTPEGRLASAVHFLAYLGLAFYVLKNYSRDWRNILSPGQGLQLRWLRAVNVLTIGAYLAYSLLLIKQLFSGEPGLLADIPSPGVVVFLSFVFLNFTGFNLIRHLVDEFPTLAESTKPPSIIARETKEQTNPAEFEELKTLLEDYMRDQKPYLDGKLNLNKLAEQLELSPRKLSQLFNSAMDTNFYDYINRFRVLEVQSLLQENRGSNLLEIAFEAGFQSKSSFNKNFLKHTGQTPSHYQKNLGATDNLVNY